MGKNESKQKTYRGGINVWLVVLFLLIGIMVSLVLLTPMLGKLTNNDRDIIPIIYNGEQEIVNRDGWSYIRVEEAPDVNISDGEKQWGVNTEIDLFKSAYANDRGEITVDSLQGDKVIASGTSNTYRFSFQNTGNISLDYTMHFESVFTLLGYELPMQVRLRSADGFIIGGESNWVYAKDINEATHEGTVEAYRYADFTFEWQWPFESGSDGDSPFNDLNDTEIANAAVNQDVNFQLSIGIESTVTPGAVPVDEDGKELLTPLVLWNVVTRIMIPVFGAILLLLIPLIIVRRPVLVTGFIPEAVGGEVKLGRNKREVLPLGRFLFERVYTGKKRLVSGEKECPIRLKYNRKAEGIVFESKDDLLVISISRKIKAIELYLTCTEAGILVSQGNWAAIDKKRNVITPDGVKEPVEKENTTPGGLHINADGEFEIPSPDGTVN